MKQAFTTHRFSTTAAAMIDTINVILEQYRAQNFRLSLRQLYYQLVARSFIENTVRSYKNIGNLVSDARQAGLIDWEMIEDRGRETVSVSHWDSPADIVRSAAHSFRIDKWEDQDHYVTVMVEKDALSGVLEPVCRELDISITANKGYSSSTMYEIGRRLHNLSCDGKEITVIYLGDHDPSGIDMTRDVDERLAKLAAEAECAAMAVIPWKEDGTAIVNLRERLFAVSDLNQDHRFKSWAKEVTGVDRTLKNGYAFQGEFIDPGTTEVTKGERVYLLGAVTGSRKNQITSYQVVVMDEAGVLHKTDIETDDSDAGWALRIRDDVAALLSEV